MKKRIKRIVVVLLVVAAIFVISYLIYTGGQVHA